MAWDDKDFDALITAIGLGADIANNDANIKLAEAKMIQTGNIAKQGIQAKAIADQQVLDLDSQNTNINAMLTEVNKSIKENVKIQKGHDVNVQDWFKIPDKEKSPFGEQSLEELGLEYLGSYKYQAKVADNAQQQIKNNLNLLNMNRQIAEKFDEQTNKIWDLYDEHKKVADDGRFKNVVELEELERHIQKNPDIFASRDDDGNIIRYDSDMNNVIDDKDMFETNELAKAFVSEKKQTGTGIDYGYYDPALEATARASVSGSLDDIEKVADESWNNKVGLMFRDIKSTENQLKDENTEKATKGFFKQTGGTVKDYLGTSKMYENKDEALTLKGTLEERIAKLISWGDSGMSGEKEGIANRAKLAIQNPNVRNDMIKLIVDKSLQSEPGQALYGIGWASEDMTNVDLSTSWGRQETEENLLKKYMEAWKILDNKFPGSTMDF